MLVICFEKGKLCGGLGDRIVGLISIRLISKLLNRKFYILWNKENVKSYLNYEKYDYELLNIIEKDIKTYKYIDNQQGLKKYLMTSSKLFPNKINRFNLRLEKTFVKPFTPIDIPWPIPTSLSEFNFKSTT